MSIQERLRASGPVALGAALALPLIAAFAAAPAMAQGKAPTGPIEIINPPAGAIDCLNIFNRNDGGTAVVIDLRTDSAPTNSSFSTIAGI